MPCIHTLLFSHQVSMSVLLRRLTLIHEHPARAHGRAPLQDVFHPWNPPFAEISALAVIAREAKLISGKLRLL
jgi:hypothetical protein